jgi:protein subunit release factor B
MPRSDWLAMTDKELLAGCSVDTYRASGPGGQKRNKTSSAVRLRHSPSGVLVIAEESRSQHENKARALRRLRRDIALQIREPFTPASELDWDVGRKDERFWPLAAGVLDAFDEANAQVSTTAAQLGTTTARLIAFLQTDEKLWQRANEIRRGHGQKPLH